MHFKKVEYIMQCFTAVWRKNKKKKNNKNKRLSIANKKSWHTIRVQLQNRFTIRNMKEIHAFFQSSECNSNMANYVALLWLCAKYICALWPENVLHNITWLGLAAVVSLVIIQITSSQTWRRVIQVVNHLTLW